MAAAIQVGKTTRMDYIFKDFQANDWPYYSCWVHLKGNRAFLPPSPPTAENMVNLEDDEEEEEEEEVILPTDEASELTHGSSLDNSSPTSNVTSPTATNVARAPTTVATAPVETPKRSRSRGPGPGAKKTKKLAKEDDYKKKKAKFHEGLLEVQRKRQEDFASYVNNQARATAFKMALSAYKVFVETDPEAAEHYKNKMEDIMMYDTNADAEDNAVTDGDN